MATKNVKVNWSPTNFEELLRKYPDVVSKEVRITLEQSSNLVKFTAADIIMGSGRVDTTKLYKSILGGPDTATTIVSDSLAKIGSALKYANTINAGRSPGEKMPPKESLSQWLKNKRTFSTEKEFNRNLFNLQKSIAKKGLKGINFANKALNKEISNIETLTNDSAERILKEVGFK